MKRTVEYIKSLKEADEDNKLYELNSSFVQLFELIKHTRNLVKTYLGAGGINYYTSEKFYLLPSLVRSIYCLASIYIEEVFKVAFKNSRSNTYSMWFMYNSKSFKNEKNYNTLFKAYLISTLRHIAVVHSGQSLNQSPGFIGSASDGSYKYTFSSSNQHLKRSQVIEILKKIRDELEKIPNIPSYKRILYNIDDKNFYETRAIEELFYSLPAFEGTPYMEARRYLAQIVQDHGTESFDIIEVEKIIDDFLPAMFDFRDNYF